MHPVAIPYGEAGDEVRILAALSVIWGILNYQRAFAQSESDCSPEDFAPKNAAENGVDGAATGAANRTCARRTLFVEEFADVPGSKHNAILETRFRFPRGHRVSLHPLVRILARRAVLDEILQKLP